MEMPKTGDVQFFEHQKTASHQISLQILIPRPTFTLKQVKPGFLLHGNAENRQCSIFWNIKKRRHTKSHLKFGFPVLHLP